MGDVLAVEVPDGVSHLVEPEPGSVFWQGSMLPDERQQVSPFRQLEKYEDSVVSAHDAVGLDDVGVPDLAEDLQLSGEELMQELFVFGFALVDDFAGKFGWLRSGPISGGFGLVEFGPQNRGERTFGHSASEEVSTRFEGQRVRDLLDRMLLSEDQPG